MQNKKLFRNATLRLTAIYLIILLSISMLFSFGLYRVGSDELQKSIRRPNTTINEILQRLSNLNNVDLRSAIETAREQEIQEAQNRLRNNLILINLFIVLSGGMLSYALARRTLVPIEQAHESQSRFTADASHELRTPISAMRLETEVALTDPSLTLKDAKKQLESNIEELDKLTKLSENLLQLAQLEGNELETSAVLIDDVVRQALKRVSNLADNNDQTIIISGTKKISVPANQEALVGVLVILLENAIKYSDKAAKCSVVTSLNFKSCTVKVSDEGIGIAKKDMPYIFDRFYRADNSRTASSENGYGIGLSIAKSAIEALGGTITATKNKKKGTTFTLTLPTS